MAGTIYSVPELDTTIQALPSDGNSWSRMAQCLRAANLVVKPNASNPTFQVDVAADFAVLLASSGLTGAASNKYAVVQGAASLTVSMATEGAGGQEVKTGLVGTLSTSTTTVTGSGTAFLTDFQIGDVLQVTSGAQSGQVRRITNVASNTSMTLESAFGADQSAGTTYKRGGEAPNTWYGIYLIGDTTSANPVALMLSTRTTALQLPTGYNVAARIGSVRNDGSSNIISFRQHGTEHYFDDRQTVFTDTSDSSGFGDQNPLAPSWATAALLEARAETDGSATGIITVTIRRDGSSGTTGAVQAKTTATASRVDRVTAWVPLVLAGTTPPLATFERDADFAAGASGTGSGSILAFRENFIAS